jgi:hypothetical protein
LSWKVTVQDFRGYRNGDPLPPWQEEHFATEVEAQAAHVVRAREPDPQVIVRVVKTASQRQMPSGVQFDFGFAETADGRPVNWLTNWEK